MNYRVVTILMNDVYTMEQGGPGNLDEARLRLYEAIDDLNNPGLGHPWRVGSKRLAIELIRRYMDGNIPERIRNRPIGDSPNDVKWELLSDETKRGVIDVLDGDFFVDRWFKNNFVKLWRANEGLLMGSKKRRGLPTELVIMTLKKSVPTRIQKSRRLDKLVVLLVARNIRELKREIPNLQRVLASLLKKRGGRRKRRTHRKMRTRSKKRKTNKVRRKSNRRRKSRK